MVINMKKIILIAFLTFITYANFAQVSGGIVTASGGGFSPQAVSTTTTLTNWQVNVPIDATAGNLTVTLPDAIANSAKQIVLSRIDATANIVTIAAAAGQTIEGNATYVMGNGARIILQSNGTSDIKILNATVGVAEFNTVALSSNTTIGIGNSSVATALLMPGMTFTAQSSGTFEVCINIHSNQTVANQTVTAILVNASAPTVALPNSETIIANAPSNGEFSGSKTFSVTANAGDVFQVRGYNNAGAATAAFITNALGRSTLYWNKISTPPAVAGIAGALQGQLLFSTRVTADNGNWILMDGRLKSTLTAAQQTVATSLGMGINIDDFRGRYITGAGGTFVLATPNGSNNLAQNNFPNITIPFAGSTTGNAIWTYNGTTGNARISNGGFSFDGTSVGNVSVSGSTSSINGNVTQQAFTPANLPVNVFMWLGPTAQAVTVTQPLSLTTIGTGLPTLSLVTGALNIPNNSLVVTEGGTIGSQTLGSAAWQLVTGGSVTVPTTGQYKVEYSLSWTNPSANTLFTRVTNSGGTHQSRSAASTGGLANTNHQTFIANYTAGEVIKLEWVHTTGTTTLVNNTAGTANAGGETYIRIIKIN
jgi:hypothetical protein